MTACGHAMECARTHWRPGDPVYHRYLGRIQPMLRVKEVDADDYEAAARWTPTDGWRDA